jgi:hypothetical protein
VEECGECHEHLYETYFDTYHGKVTRLGSALAAKCSDCHTPHANLPPDDSASSVHPVNRVETCAECHAEASARFVQYLPHGDHGDRERYPVLYWTWLLMTSLLIGVFTFFGIHTVLWLVRASIGDRFSPKPAPVSPTSVPDTGEVTAGGVAEKMREDPGGEAQP